ncbi:PREDICTED: importin subunit alpha-9 isoform X2 [Vollenhovia emeryi]|uniref:importin subunit alpha-9 isoform X2 n=1 Tax=Vollenhovia emeryi TaxID=411798 RepID=UPI0005F4567A|nr:PREDICTED: importin subunit alpha-9 isoform X2 [Vollenhovia emeryi]
MQTVDGRENEAAELGSSDSNVVETLRTELREAASTKRKESRVSAWNRSRTNLGECPGVELFSAEHVDEKSEENINAFLKVDQSLSGLVRDLSGGDPTLQLYAANCCCNIALGNTKACMALGKAVIPYLVIKLESLNYALLDVCIWTIGNLVAGSDKAFSILHAQHCLKYIILLLHNCDDSVLPSVIYALLHYVHAGFHKISESEMLELVQVVVKRNLLYENPNYIWLLALLSSSPICAEHLSAILPEVVDYLYLTFSNSDGMTRASEITASVRILANTLHTCCEDKVKILLKNPKYSNEELHLLLNKLLSHPHMHIRRETLWLIGNLYNHKSPNIGQNIRDLMPSLSALKQAFSSVEHSV